MARPSLLQSEPVLSWTTGREKKNPDQYLEKRCLHFSKTEGVEHETNDVNSDDRKELLGSVQVPVWNLYFRRE
jgi:hypothetical protein